MKKIVVLIALGLLTIDGFKAQTPQTYNGPYGTGKAIYQYYENAQADRIYNGSFSYKGDLFSFTGQFKENNREGLWKIGALNKVYANDKKVKVQHNAAISGFYIGGNMDSVWNYSNTIKFYNPKTKKPGKKIDKIDSKAHFKNNRFVGTFTYEHTTAAGKQTCIGQFNDKGLPDGNWVIKSIRETEEITYKNGMQISHFIKDLTTGDKKINTDSSAFIQQFWNNYDAETKLATVDQKIYFLDTIPLMAEYLAPWTNANLEIKDFGLSRNALYDFKKGQANIAVYQVRIISCDMNTDCYKKYQERKTAEMERQKKLKAEEDERRRLEVLSKEEETRKEREKQQEEQRKMELEALTKNADDLFNRKKYREAKVVYEQINKKGSSVYANTRILEINTLTAEIDKSHQYRTSLHQEIQNALGPIHTNSTRLEMDLKAKKKVYATNFKLCMDDMMASVQPKMEQMEGLNDVSSNPELLNSWTEADKESLLKLEEIKKEVVEITNFQNAVSMALSTGNKAHLRILNSSLNPKIIVKDMINFK